MGLVRVLSLLTVLVLTRTQSPPCCRGDEDRTCACAHAGLSSVPWVPDQTWTLDLDYNQISEVHKEDLRRLQELRVLMLRANRLRRIDPGAFNALTDLKELDLSENNLTTIDHHWFSQLGALERLQLHHNPYKALGAPALFRPLIRLRSLSFGGESLEEVLRSDLQGLGALQRLHVVADNLQRFESGALAQLWPPGHVTLSLRSLFESDPSLAALVIRDAASPETELSLENLHLENNRSVLPLRETVSSRVRRLSFQNLFITDETVVEFLKVTDGTLVSSLSIYNITLWGEGRWEKASRTDHRSVTEVFIRDALLLNNFDFTSFLPLSFILQYLRKISLINTKVFVMPCPTSVLLKNLQYLDVSENLLTDLTLTESLCSGAGVLKSLRVLNLSANSIKSLSLVSRLVSRLSVLSRLDVSRNTFSSMPESCPWPESLRFLNISRAKLQSATSCLPPTLQVLDLSFNDLQNFQLDLPVLKELHLSGNKLLALPPGSLLPNLHHLSIQLNTLNAFSRSELLSFRRLRSFEAGSNPFVCSCGFVPFFRSMVDGDLNVTLSDSLRSYTCDSPLHLQGAALVHVRRSLVECHRVLVVVASCGVVLLGLLVCGVLLWKVHAFWYLHMMVVWLAAKRRRRRREEEEEQPLVLFDAFVSYSERDSVWVNTYLLPELEGTGCSSETAPESGPGARPESSSGTCPDSALGPDSGPGPSPDSGPGPSPDSGPSPGSGPGPGPDSGPSPDSGASPGPDSGPGPSPDSGPSPHSGAGPGPDSGPGPGPGPEPLRLCLHHRDFLPGRWIMDNIVSSIESSRCTLFVLSQNFVRSDWCRYELDFTHFQLLEGHSREDAAVLVLLEPLSHDEVPKRFCRLRQLLRSTTFLSWPQDPDPDLRDQFWTSLRRALRPDQDQD